MASQAGTPRVKAEGVYNAAERSYTLTLSQSCPATPGQPTKEPFVIPVNLGLLAHDGRELPLQLAHWNVSEVARRTGLARMTLYRRMKRAGIVAPNRA